MKRYLIVAIALLLAACSYGGVGMPGSEAWKMTASPEDQARYYRDHTDSKATTNLETEVDNWPTFQSDLTEAGKSCDAIVKSAYPADASQDDIVQGKYSPSRGGVGKIIDCVTEQQKPVWKKYYPTFADLYEASRAKVAIFAENYDNGEISYTKFVAKQKHEEKIFNNNVRKRNDSINKEYAKRAEFEARQAKKEAALREEKANQEAAKQKANELAEERRKKHAIEEADSKTCLSYGFQKGTTSYTDCRIKLPIERERQEAAKKIMEEQRQQAIEAQQQAEQRQQQLAEQAAAQQQQRCMLAYSQGLLQPTLGGSSMAAVGNAIATLQAAGCR